MTVTEILEQVKALPPAERQVLVAQLQAMEDTPQPQRKLKTGAEIVAMLEAMDAPIELVDSHIEDAVEWVKAQRQKRKDKLQQYWDEES